jgi:glycosyltransferase involved in cell wall biosynthesis
VIAVVPAHNEGPRVSAVVAGARRLVSVLVVDDGSTDDTAERARAAGAEVLRRAPNAGKGAALRAGFRRALDTGCDAVVILDADGQHDPTEIPSFLDAWARTGADLVIGRRDFAQMPVVRRVSNIVGTAAFSWAVGRRIPDNQSGYRLLSTRLAERLLGGDESGFEFDMEMIVVALRDGFSIEWVPIRTIYAGQSSHIRPVRHLASFLRVVRAARRSVRAGPGRAPSERL